MRPIPNVTKPDRTTIGGGLARSPDIRHFLELYCDALEASDGSLGLFSLPHAVTFASRDLDELVEQAAHWAAEKMDVYIHIHLHTLSEGMARQRGSLETVRAAIGIFSDIDARGPGRKKPAATLCPTVEDAISVVEEFNRQFSPLRTSLIIASGYGCYPAILLKEPFVLTASEDKRLLESFGRRFHQALHNIAAQDGWTGAVDYCDLAKVLRVPGCVNYKDAGNPQPVRVVCEDAGRFTLSDLDELLPTIHGGHPSSGDTSDVLTFGEVAISLKPDVQIEPALAIALRDAHPLFAPTWDNQRSDLENQSCSGYDFALANIGVACGLTDQQVADLLISHRARFQRSKQERRGASYLRYLCRTIGRARGGNRSSQAAATDWAEFERNVQPASDNHIVEIATQSESGETVAGATQAISTDGNPTAELSTSAPGDGAASEPGAGNCAAAQNTAAALEPAKMTGSPHKHKPPDVEPSHPYRERNRGIVRIKASKDGSEEIIPLTNFRASLLFLKSVYIS